MPLMISRIGQARGRPVPFAAGRWGSITRHSSSVTSVLYRLALRLCFLRVVGVHMVSPGLVSATPPLESRPSQPLNRFRNGLLGEILHKTDNGHAPAHRCRHLADRL